LELADGEKLKIQPGESVLITTDEYIGLPRNRSIAGQIKSKVSLVSQGLSHISTTIDNDWERHLLISLTNLQSYPITLTKGDAICTAMFFESRTPATRGGGKPPGRLDIVEKRLDDWLNEAKKNSKASWRLIIPVAIIALFSVGGYLLFGSSEGFSAVVATGVALAMIAQTITSP
jgi:hypothetical protein